MSGADIALIITSTATSIGALYGVWTSYDDRRHRNVSNIKLTVMEDAYIVGDSEQDTLEKTVMRAINLGERAVTINSAGATYYDTAGSVLYSPLAFQGSHVVEPNKDVAVFAPLQNKNEPKIAYYWVTTSLSKQFKYYVMPKSKVRWRNLLDRLRIYPKKQLKKPRLVQGR